MLAISSLATAGIILGLVSSVALLADLVWLSPERKTQFADRLKNYAEAIAQDDSRLLIVQAPLRIVGAIYDALLGDSLLSRTAFLRSIILSIVILLVGLALAGHRLGVPFALKTNFAERNFAELTERNVEHAETLLA